MKKFLSLIYASTLIWVSGCVGTDFIADPLVKVPPRIEITPPSGAIQVGERIRFFATYYDSLGDPVPRASFTWHASETGIVTLDSGGEALAISPGQTGIMARSTGTTSPPALLTVVADPARVATVVVAPDSALLAIGDSLQFSATAFNLSNAAVPGAQIAWRSTAPAIVTVDATGKVIGVSEGMAGIVASVDGVDSVPAVVSITAQSRTGNFVKRPGTSYSVSGTANMRMRDDGTVVLEFGSDFSTSNGPGLYVYLSTSNQVGSGSLELARLQRTSGAQTYTLPQGTGLTDFDWVIIHCKPFNVTFGYAELK